MAMEVEAYMPDQYLRPSYKAFNHERPFRTFEIRVIYVRIISSKCMGCKMEIAFPPPRDPKTRFQVNGAEIGERDGFSMALNKNRVDTVMAESTYVSTNTIGFCGSLLCFEIRVKGLLCPVVVGVVRRRDGCMWVMECTDQGLVPDGGMVVDVYFAGSSMGKPLLLNGLMDLRKPSLSCIPESDHEPQEIMEERCLAEEQGNGGGLRDLCSKGEMEMEMEMEMDGEEKDGECEGDLAWFNAGVGVGVSLGLGIGLGLIVRTYQAAAGVLRRFI